MDQRLQLQYLLEETLGSANVYFQPAVNIEMEYPCIVYVRDRGDTKFAGNSPYRYTQRYQVTLIDRDPDNPAIEKIAALPMTTFNRFFKAESLNHDVFTLYF